MPVECLPADTHAPFSSAFLDQVVLVGASYRTANLETRSALSLAGEKLEAFRLQMQERGAQSVLILSTCNRTEVYVTGIQSQILFGALAELSPAVERSIYVKHGEDAATHIFRVACGLDSAAVGETEILAQVKLAWREAGQARLMGGVLDLLCRRAIEVSKRVRTETDLCRNVISVASMAIRQAGGLAGKRVLLLGAGAMAERLAKEISLAGVESCVVLNRTAARAEALAERYGFSPGLLSRLVDELPQADVVFVAVPGDKLLIDSKLASERPSMIVDLGVPSAVGPMPAHVKVIDMEHLAAACEANAKVRASALGEAEAIVQHELQNFLAECGEREVAPAIQSLVQLGDRVRQENLGWALANLDGLSQAQQKVVEDLALRIVRGVLQGPISVLKSPSLPPGQRDALAVALQSMPQGAGD